MCLPIQRGENREAGAYFINGIEESSCFYGVTLLYRDVCFKTYHLQEFYKNINYKLHTVRAGHVTYPHSSNLIHDMYYISLNCYTVRHKGIPDISQSRK